MDKIKSLFVVFEDQEIDGIPVEISFDEFISHVSYTTQTCGK